MRIGKIDNPKLQFVIPDDSGEFWDILIRRLVLGVRIIEITCHNSPESLIIKNGNIRHFSRVVDDAETLHVSWDDGCKRSR